MFPECQVNTVHGTQINITNLMRHPLVHHVTCREIVCSVFDTMNWLTNLNVISNDNDNDTLREVPHRSNEGLALQARVSGPWPHKKESVLQVKFAPWQGVQVQTVVDRV